MEKRDLIYEGKAKRLFSTDDPNLVIAEFKDDLTAFNGAKKDSEAGKGALNNKISTELFKMLASRGIESHFVEMLDDNHMLCKKVDIILIEVIVRNVATGSLSKNLGIPDG
ncbi:phosphoribosylaminoimidazolesuccinocarboxamide synthase, partial [Sulfuricurvum sp.]